MCLAMLVYTSSVWSQCYSLDFIGLGDAERLQTVGKAIRRCTKGKWMGIGRARFQVWI